MKTRLFLPVLAIFLAMIMVLAPVSSTADAAQANHSTNALFDIFNGVNPALRIHPWVGDQTFSVDDRTFVYHAWFFGLFEEKFADLQPFDISLYVNGEEVAMMRFTYLFPNAIYRIAPGPDFFLGDRGAPYTINFAWFVIFEPGYFEPGTYSWQVIWTASDFYLEASATMTFV